MKMIIAFSLVFVAVALAAPQKEVEIVSQETDNIGTGDYKFGYVLSDGTSRQEQGVLKNPGTENEAISVSGTVTWTDLEGNTYTLTYTADENGFHPEGNHLPKA